MVVTKGALTGAVTTSNSGGFWGPELKFAGYDLLMLEGRAPNPSYLLVYDDRVEVRDAAAYWGRGVFETEDGRLISFADKAAYEAAVAADMKVRDAEANLQ